MTSSQFYVTLPSTSSFKYFPNNKLSSYTTHLHSPLRLVGDWEVGLVEISYPRTWYNISGDACDVYYRGKHDIALEVVKLPSGYYETVDEIIIEIMRALPQHLQKDIQLYVKAQCRKLVINCSNSASIQFNKSLSRMLGFEDNVLIQKDTHSSFPVDIHRGFYSLYVYSDIVSSQYVGDTLAPLLRTVEMDHSTVGGMVCKTYNSPHYVPVKLRDIETIKIDLRLDSGKLLPFESGQVICKVHFRLRKSSYLI